MPKKRAFIDKDLDHLATVKNLPIVAYDMDFEGIEGGMLHHLETLGIVKYETEY